MRELRVLAPTGNLGHSPIQKDSFFEGLKHGPHFISADAGSGDVGPSFLGADVAHNPVEWERHDLELLIQACREPNIPLIIGSAGTNGTNRGVDLFIQLISEIAAEHRLQPFKVAAIYAEVDGEYLLRRVRSGEDIPGLGGFPSLTEEDVQSSDHIVAMMGVEPIMRALEMGADVVVAGRSCDDALFAAIPILQGYPRGLAFHLGKCLECASLVAEPMMVKETVMGTIREDSIVFEPMHPEQICSPESVAAHSMYERVDPYIQAMPGGMLDTHAAVYEAIDGRRTKVTGSQFIPASLYRVKLEGAGKIGERCFSVVGLRDPNAIRHLEDILRDVRRRVTRQYPNADSYQLMFHVYGRDGVMGPLEPTPVVNSHEVCIVSEIIAADKKLATDLAKLTQYGFLFARYPNQRSSGGGAALLIDEALSPEHSAYRWTIDHLLMLQDPLELFPIKVIQIGGA